MQVGTGKSILNGIAIGKLKIYKKKDTAISTAPVADTAAELERFEAARQKAIEQQTALYEKALAEAGEDIAEVFNIHAMMLDDDDFVDAIKEIINGQHMCAEYAVKKAGDNQAAVFAAMDDPYLQARSADVIDIAQAMLDILQGVDNATLQGTEPSILVAEDLAPSETVQMDKSKILSFVTQKGSVNSHTAILARTMGIPALIGSDIVIDESLNGKFGVVDGTNGVVYIEPDEATLSAMQEEQRKDNEKKALLQELKGKEDVTLDGKKIKLYSNIGNIKDLANVIANDAAGIGLFRSEFIYLESETFPTEEEQFNIYRTVAESMAGKPVIIRTLDIGADKQCDYFGLDKEDNPALGLRAIRICLTRPEIFKTQLRALYRASAYGNISIMYPMIISEQEVDKIKVIENEVKAELTEQGIEFGNPKSGIMIEPPAAVIMSRQLAKKVDFFSIGTNDLTQYTLAIDRQNTKLDDFYDAHHPAILAMIRMVVENAHAEGIWAGICGELGADTTLTEEFLKMGVDELSVSAGKVLAVRKVIRETRVS